MNKSFIEVKNISKKIKGNYILNNITMNLERGKIYGFRGKNGVGKTMLFRAICGLITLTEGEISINNEVLGKDISFPRSVGVLIEYPGFIENLTGFKNLKYLAGIKGIIGDEKIIDTLKAVGLDPDDKRKVRKYSLGMKQRLGIAQAIMEEPDIIILDEPNNALDVDGVSLINEILLKLKKENKVILICSHDKEELEEIADEIYVMSKGEITENIILEEKKK